MRIAPLPKLRFLPSSRKRKDPVATRITQLAVRDIRFPTSRSLDGSDAMNAAPD